MVGLYVLTYAMRTKHNALVEAKGLLRTAKLPLWTHGDGLPLCHGVLAMESQRASAVQSDQPELGGQAPASLLVSYSTSLRNSWGYRLEK